MSLQVDGAAILKALAKNPRAFAMSRADVDMIATAAVASKLKKGLALPALRSMAKAMGRSDFSTIVGGLSAKDAKGLARLDAGHPKYATADAHWHRARIIALACGEAEPVPSSEAAPRAVPAMKDASEPKLPKIGKVMASAAHAAAARVRKPGARKSSACKSSSGASSKGRA